MGKVSKRFPYNDIYTEFFLRPTLETPTDSHNEDGDAPESHSTTTSSDDGNNRGPHTTPKKKKHTGNIIPSVQGLSLGGEESSDEDEAGPSTGRSKRKDLPSSSPTTPMFKRAKMASQGKKGKKVIRSRSIITNSDDEENEVVDNGKGKQKATEVEEDDQDEDDGQNNEEDDEDNQDMDVDN